MQGNGEMKIAVPLYHERVAPHFGSAKQVLLVEIEQNRSVRESRCDLSGKGVMAAGRLLFEKGVSMVVCAGIEAFFKNWLIGKGVNVVDNQTGPAREVLRAILQSRQEAFSKKQRGGRARSGPAAT